MSIFGTDGIRGLLGCPPLTWFGFTSLFSSLAVYCVEKNITKVCIGRDTRTSSPMISDLLIACLRGYGVDVLYLGVVPTGMVSYYTKMECDLGVMITASHNQGYDNGLKFMKADGSKWMYEDEEEFLDMLGVVRDCEWLNQGKLIDGTNYFREYLDNLSRSNPCQLALYSVVVDCANGSACNHFIDWLESMGLIVVKMNADAIGGLINVNSACFDYTLLVNNILKHNAIFGIAFDGDADRLIMVDDKGCLWDGDDIILLLVKIGLAKGEVIKGVVITEMSNTELSSALESFGVEVAYTKVGDKNIAHLLDKYDWFYGAEACGHIINRNFVPISDPFSVLYTIMHYLASERLKLSQCNRLKKYPQINVSLPLFSNLDEMQQYVCDYYPDIRWVIRKSGTEKVTRIMCEGSSFDLLKKAIIDIKSKFYGIETLPGQY